MTENKNKKVMYSIIGIAILLISLVGVTYSFFNYTRTGALNNLGTGRIYFNSTQNGTLNMTNIFPLTSTQAGEAQLDTVTVGIVGDTTYADGEEFEIRLVDVTNTINGKKIPISYIATYAATPGNSIGTSSDTYWESRNSKNADIYTLTETGKVEEGKQVLVGYIKNGATGINGTLTIKAYIDADRIAITDTPEENTEWQQGRTVFTTSEWNSFQSSGTPISFKIKAESNEGIWVEEPEQGTIESCPGCKFMYTTDVNWTTWNTNSSTPTQITSGLYDNYEELIATTGKNYFLGVKLNNNNEVTNAYACGVKDGTPFCIEGTSDGSKYTANQTLLQGANLYNNTCSLHPNSETGYGYDYVECGPWDNSGSLSASAYSFGGVGAGVGYFDFCVVNDFGDFGCTESVSGGGEHNTQLTMETMCPGCVYTYTETGFWTTWNTNNNTPTVLTSSDYSTNYEDVILSSGKNFFLGLKLNGSNEIEKAYACGLYNDTTPFCIEGYYDNSKYEANQNVLQNEGLWNNTCNVRGDLTDGYTECLAPSSGLVRAYADSFGSVSAVVDDGGSCLVNGTGRVLCDDGSIVGPSS